MEASGTPAGAGDGTWFDAARLGLFVHWTHTSTQGRELSWPLVGGVPVLPAEPVPVEEYYAHALDFCPEPGAPREWIAVARDAGARYAVLTAKHHDGFALWPTEQTDFSIAATPYDGDLVGEFVEACRQEGVRVGLYYSLSDWHHPDYPAYEGEGYVAYLGRRSEPEAWERYLAVLFGQVRELCTRYGPLDLLWFDGQWERTAEEWRAAELRALVAELAPGCLVNDRLPGQGDFETPEQAVPAVAPDGRWETCLTMNRSWGHVPDDTDYKPATRLVHTLCETAGKGGNLLLNVGPDGAGRIPEPQRTRLAAIGRWLADHDEAVVGTSPGLEPWQWYGPSTRRGDTWYLHLLARPYGTVSVRGVPIRRVASVRDVATGRTLGFAGHATAAEELFVADPTGEVVIEVPDDLVDPPATVLALEITPP